MLPKNLCNLCKTEFQPIKSHQIYCGSKTNKTGCSFKAWKKRQAAYALRYYRKHKNDPNQITKRRNRNYARSKRKTFIESFSLTCQICKNTFPEYWYFDIDHKDGDRKNNDPSNLWILCPNCHRIKTFTNKEFLNHKYRKNPSSHYLSV